MTTILLSFTVDGQQIEAPDGDNLLQRLKAQGFDVPSMCFRPEAANDERPLRCGLCLVEIDGEVHTSCTRRVSRGLVVRTNTPRIMQARKDNLEKLMAEHYSEEMCANCIWDSGCLLHTLAAELGLEVAVLTR